MRDRLAGEINFSANAAHKIFSILDCRFSVLFRPFATRRPVQEDVIFFSGLLQWKIKNRKSAIANRQSAIGNRKSQIFDWPVVLFVAAAFVSLAASANLRLSLRELRVVVLEPVLLYFLLTRTVANRQGAWRLTGALLAAGVVV
ncbi:MAG: hypothetical protein NTY44_11040, partial [Deltaproteobacteria bacterium]|nr:hypothetical protein [Deltaproteobacteria bacterium]